MDTITRNQIFMENNDLITRIMKRNYPLLRAMRLDPDDVYQELSIAALNAINTFDPVRSDQIRAHIWMKLQYAILDIRRRHKPYGMTAVCHPWPQVCSVELSEENGYPLPDPAYSVQDAARDRRLRQALARLEPQEREVVILYLEGVNPVKKAQRREFTSALEKLKEFYVAAQVVMEGIV